MDEVLTDVADDLFDYEKDVAQNSFNVLRGAVHASRPVMPLHKNHLTDSSGSRIASTSRMCVMPFTHLSNSQ